MSNNPHIAKRLAEKAEAVRQSHSYYWLGDLADTLAQKVQEGSIEYIERLRAIQRGIAGFVKIVTGKEIPVHFSSGQQSYTNGESVVISADTNPETLDVTVGTALHESTHVHISGESLKFLKFMYTHFTSLIANTQLLTEATRLGMPVMPADPKLAGAMGNTNSTGLSVYSLVQMVMNVLEDRRIDYWMYRSAPGYQPYYDAMYNKYWHSPEISKALTHPAYSSKNVENFLMHVINMTNAAFNASRMPGLAEIRKVASLAPAAMEARGNSDPKFKTYSRNIGKMEEMPKLFRDAVRIVEIILENSERVDNPDRPQKGKKNENGEGSEGNGIGDLPNLDHGRVMSAVERQRKFLNHETDKKQLSATSKSQLDQLSDTKADIRTVDGDFIGKGVKAKVVIYRNVTKATLANPTFPFHLGYGYGRLSTTTALENPQAKEGYLKGIRMGAILAARIAVMQDESTIKFTRQLSGRLDKRLIANLGFGQQSVFSHTMIERKEPANVWIDIDASGSMKGVKFTNAIAVAVAIAYAAEKTRTLNCVVALRDGGHNVANIAILYDSRRHSMAQLRNIMPFVAVCGGTPEGLAFEAVKEEILAMGKGERKFFINLSDGEPAHNIEWKGQHFSYGGENAFRHTRSLINDFRLAGIKVLSYYIDAPDKEQQDNFKKMYGNDAVFVDPTQVTGIVRTVNRLLMEE